MLYHRKMLLCHVHLWSRVALDAISTVEPFEKKKKKKNPTKRVFFFFLLIIISGDEVERDVNKQSAGNPGGHFSRVRAPWFKHINEEAAVRMNDRWVDQLPPTHPVKTNTPEQTCIVRTQQPFILSSGLRRTSGHKQANRASPCLRREAIFFLSSSFN